jgi:hypothetical protein
MSKFEGIVNLNEVIGLVLATGRPLVTTSAEQVPVLEVELI